MALIQRLHSRVLDALKGTRSFSRSAAPFKELAYVVKRRVAAPRQLQVGDPDTLLKSKDRRPVYPPYPYGEATTYKQSNRGLYGGKTLQYGHQISEWGNKHVRVFHPNIQRVSLWSEALKRVIKVRVVTSVLRTITKEGGLDNYLLKDTPSRIKQLGPLGWRLRFEVLKRIEEHSRTAPRPMPEGFKVGRSRLIKDLFLATQSQHGKNLKLFMASEKATPVDDLVKQLAQAGIDTSKYLSS